MSDVAKKKIIVENYKESLSIEVTNHCKSACRHCFVRARLSEASSLSFEFAKKIIEEGYNIGYRHLHITGGEPLLWQSLFDALDFAFGAGYQTVFLNTNGIFLTESINRLSEYEGLSLSVSLEGTEAFHNQLRGEGSYRQTVKNIERALDAGLNLIIFTAVGKTLLAGLPYYTDELYRRFPDIKCLSLIQLIRVTNDVFDLSSELLDPDDFLKFVRMVSLLNLYGHKTEILNNPLAVVVSKLLEVPWIPRVLPLHRSGHLIVMANGNITLSHSTSDSFGIYEAGMIEKVLSSNKYRIDVGPDEITCPACKYAKLCKENGMIRPSEWYRDMCPDVPYCRRVLDRVDP
jgi:MoaA/NifB/PqqE/SkfB family radical SAM enzyme